MPKLADSRQKRVPLNCLVLPSTKQEIQERAVNGKSQGDVIDEAVCALYRETGTAYDPHAAARAALATGDIIIETPSGPQMIRKSVNGEMAVPARRPTMRRGIREKGDKSR